VSTSVAEPVIELRSVVKDYQLGGEAIRVLHGISMAVHRGDYVAIMGHSGSGKSTLLNIMGCLDTATNGEYLYRGLPVTSFTEARLAAVRNTEIGFVFQAFNLLPKLTIWANVELPLIYANVPAKERRKLVDGILERFGLTERRHHRPNEISGGQKQRVAIARALVKKPSVVLADEPTGNLDSHTTAEIMKLIGELNGEGNTIVLITHELDVAAHARTHYRIVDGRLSE
jgi:putative ABC transport system ATP-binding protein